MRAKTAIDKSRISCCLRLPDFFEAFHHQIGAEGGGHDGDEHRQPAAGGFDFIFPVNDKNLDEGEKDGSDDTAQHGEITQLAAMADMVSPVDSAETDGGYAAAHDAADNRVGGGDRRADISGKVHPKGGREKGGHHRPG